MSRLRMSRAVALSVVKFLIFTALPFNCLGAIQYEQTCYFPDQSVATGFTPCNISANGTQASASACCLNSSNAYCTDLGYVSSCSSIFYSCACQAWTMILNIHSTDQRLTWSDSAILTASYRAVAVQIEPGPPSPVPPSAMIP